MFVIEDESHAEVHGEFQSFGEAMAELKRRAQLPWDVEPNIAPCTEWKTCGRRYEIVEYDAASTPWREVRRTPVFEISAGGVTWSSPANGSI